MGLGRRAEPDVSSCAIWSSLSVVIPGVTFFLRVGVPAAIALALRIEVISSDVLTKGRIEGPGSPGAAWDV